MTSKSFRWIVAGILVLFLCSGIASASTRTRILSGGAVIFIGEQGLDISPAMGSYNAIAWWAPGSSPGTSLPSSVMDVSGMKTNFYVSPATYESRQGKWYLWDGTNPPNPPEAFRIAAPDVSITIWDKTRLIEATGKSAPRGDYLTFRLDTNVYDLSNKRENAPGDVDGYISYVVKTSEGATLTSLYNSALTPQPLTGQQAYDYVDYWGQGEAVPYYWATGAAPGGLYAYPSGTYTVYARFNLNGMIDNYKAPDGTDYEGRTVSDARLVTLVGTPGALTVTSNPPGASITIDNVATGAVTDTTINGIAPGTRTVKVTLSGYTTQQDTVGVDSGATSSLVFTMVPGGDTVTLVYAGDGSYYFGERIRFSGTNYESDTTYLFLMGPGLPAQGVQMVQRDPAGSPVVNGDPASFSQAVVELDNTWEYYWYTDEDIRLDEGTYEVYASAYPVDADNLVGGAFQGTFIELEWPFITATVDRAIGPVGTVFTISGFKTGGVSPNYYIYLTVTNNTPPVMTGSLPANGVSPEDFSEASVTGVNETFGMATVGPAGDWSYQWDTSAISGGSLLPGSEYRFFVMNRPNSISKAESIPWQPAPGNYSRDGYTKLQLGIEGPVTADFSYDNSNGLDVGFTDLSTGIPQYVWINFSATPTDGASMTPGGTLTHTYPAAGTYQVTLHAWNSLGEDSETKTITVTSATREQATAQVISAVFPGGVVPAGNTVYTSVEPVPAGFTVQGWSSLYLTQFSGWFVLIDEDPKANWEHPVKWSQQADGQAPVITLHTSPPRNVRLTRTAGDPPITGSTNEIGSGYTGALTGYGGGSASCENIRCDTCYALLVSGGYNAENNFDRYWDDMSAMYRTLRQTYCYPEENIYVLMSDGRDTVSEDRRIGETDYDSSPLDLDASGTDDVDGAATRAELERVLRGMSGVAPVADVHTLTDTEDLFIFTTNHGGQDPDGVPNKVRLWLWGPVVQEYIWDDEFVALLPSAPRSITLTMEQCYSGGFVEEFMAGAAGTNQKRIITTAASATEPSYGNDFSFYWIDGMTGIANEVSTKDGQPLLSLHEGYLYGMNSDPSYNHIPRLETPQYSSTGADDGAAFGLSSCSQCPELTEPVQGGAGIPTDPDGDGIYEDVNGVAGPDGRQFTMDDVVLLFQQLDWMNEHMPACAFDLNGNKRLDFVDVVMLYAEVQ